MREQVITYYHELLTHFGTYHNHKERSAWNALGLYVVLVSIINGMQAKGGVLEAVLMCLLVMLLTSIAGLYIYNQLKLKDSAAAYVAALMLLLAKLINEEVPDNELANYLSVEGSMDRSHKSSHVLPAPLLHEQQNIASQGEGAQRTTRVLLYVALLSLFVLTAVNIFLKAVG